MGHGGDDLLGEDVEGIAKDGSGLDVPFMHGACDGRAGDKVSAVLWEDDAFAGNTDLVSCAADALHAAGHRGWRFDLDDEIDRTHIDAELERRCCDDGTDGPAIELIFNFRALRCGERAVVGAGEILLGEIVDESCEALSGAAVVDKDER